MAGRRSLLAAAAAAPMLPAAALAQTGGPGMVWRLTSRFPKALDTAFVAAEVFAAAVADMTDGRFQIRVYPPGELAPANKALDVVADGTVELCHTRSYDYVARDPTFAFGSGLPFGLNSRLQNAWLGAAGGNDLLEPFYRRHGVVGIPAGNTGTQMGGWFKRELRGPEDLKGLKMRISGFAAMVVAKLGVDPKSMGGAEILAALETDQLDAAEWIGPHDDERLGYWKAAKFYYYPGWWECGTSAHIFINATKWDALSPSYKAVLKAAAAQANAYMQEQYDTLNPAAIKRLVGNGVELRAFPQDIMQAGYAAAGELYAALSARGPEFKRIYEHWSAFRADGYLWWLVNEIAMDAFMVRARASGRG